MLRNTGWRSKAAKETILSMIDEFKDPEDEPILNIESSIMDLFVGFYDILEKRTKSHHRNLYDSDYNRSVIRNMLYFEPAIEISILGWLDTNRSGSTFSRFIDIVDDLGADIFNDHEDIQYYIRVCSVV